MPQQIYSSSTTFTSSSSSTNGTTTTQSGHAQSMHASTDPATGQTTIHSTTQNLGEPAVRETQTLDSAGNLIEGTGGEAGTARVRDVTEEEAQAERDRQYEERMEDEYAKREGGA